MHFTYQKAFVLNQGRERLATIHGKLVKDAGVLCSGTRKVGSLLPPKMILKNNDIIHRHWLVCSYKKEYLKSELKWNKSIFSHVDLTISDLTINNMFSLHNYKHGLQNKFELTWVTCNGEPLQVWYTHIWCISKQLLLPEAAISLNFLMYNFLEGYFPKSNQ